MSTTAKYSTNKLFVGITDDALLARRLKLRKNNE